MVKAFYISLLYIFLSSSTWALVTAQVNRTELYDDEPVLLTVTISPKGQINQADLNALESLFSIEQKFQSERSQIINGNRTSSIEYQFRLKPKKTGTLGIPNFRVNGEQSQPVFVTVLDSSLRKDNLEEDAVIFKANIDQENIYIDQPITLTLELALKIAVQNGNFTNLNDLGFELTAIDNQQTQETINGQPYNVYRFSYQFTPKSAGIFSIPDIKFTAEYPNQTLGRYIRFTRTAPLPSLVVKGIPSNYPSGAYWLPLEQLTLVDNLDPTISVEQNEHLDWQITQSTVGTSANNLPDVLKQIENNLSSDIKLYKNNPKLEGNQRQDSAAISFVTSGEFELPAVKVPWWNITTDSLEWAEIPQRSVNVIPAQAFNISQTDIETPPLATKKPELTYQSSSPIWKLTTLLSTMGWLLTLAYFVWFKRPKKGPSNEQTVSEPSADNLQQAYQIYLNTVKDKKLSKLDICNVLNKEDNQAIAQLEKYLFANENEAPDIATVNSVIKKIVRLNFNESKSSNRGYSLYP
jgi:hypothetical protein